MGITASEWTILSSLLRCKLPNSRISELILFNSTFPIKGIQGCEVKDVEEAKMILRSLEKKGIIKIEEMIENLKLGDESREEDKKIELEKEVERINLLYILGRISATEYEKKLYEILSEDQMGVSKDIVPLTSIEKYISIARLLHEILTSIDVKRFSRSSCFTSTNDLELLIRERASCMLEEIFDFFHEYLQVVRKRIEIGSNKIAVILAYLYPFIRNLIKEEKQMANRESKEKFIQEMERLRKSIEVEREIIAVLKMLNEDKRKIKMHEIKLRELENRLGEITRIMGEDDVMEGSIIIELPGDRLNIDQVRDRLMQSFGQVELTHTQNLEKFINDLSGLLYEEFLGKLLPVHSQEGSFVGNELRIPIYEIFREYEEIGFKNDNYLLLKVSLTWMNDLCPVMLDSNLESDGGKLTMCKNLECFVVYHKECLEKLLRADTNACLVCGSPID